MGLGEDRCPECGEIADAYDVLDLGMCSECYMQRTEALMAAAKKLKTVNDRLRAERDEARIAARWIFADKYCLDQTPAAELFQRWPWLECGE